MNSIEQKFRHSAMLWWLHLTDNKQQDLTDLYYEGRSAATLTSREIEKVWSKTATPTSPQEVSGATVPFEDIAITINELADSNGMVNADDLLHTLKNIAQNSLK